MSEHQEAEWEEQESKRGKKREREIERERERERESVVGWMYCILYTRVTFSAAQLILETLINPYKMVQAEFDEFVQSLPSWSLPPPSLNLSLALLAKE